MATKVIGKPLINSQHEAFAQFIFQGYNNTEAAKLAKYSEKTATVKGSQLLSKVSVANRLQQLQESVARATVGTAIERQEILTEIYRNKREQPKARTSAIDTQNKMDRLYTPEQKAGDTINLNKYEITIRYADPKPTLCIDSTAP